MENYETADAILRDTPNHKTRNNSRESLFFRIMCCIATIYVQSAGVKIRWEIMEIHFRCERKKFQMKKLIRNCLAPLCTQYPVRPSLDPQLTALLTETEHPTAAEGHTSACRACRGKRLLPQPGCRSTSSSRSHRTSAGQYPDGKQQSKGSSWMAVHGGGGLRAQINQKLNAVPAFIHLISNHEHWQQIFRKIICKHFLCQE